MKGGFVTAIGGQDDCLWNLSVLFQADDALVMDCHAGRHYEGQSDTAIAMTGQEWIAALGSQ